MSVDNPNCSQDFAGADPLFPLPVSFPVLSIDDIYVAVKVSPATTFTNLTPGVGYTVTDLGSGNYEVNTTDFYDALTTVVRVFRSTPLTQPVDLVEGGPFPATSVEAGLDRVVMQVQELRLATGISNTPTAGPGSNYQMRSTTDFANAAARALAVPAVIGQIGVQRDTGSFWYGTTLVAGGWTALNPGDIPLSSITGLSDDVEAMLGAANNQAIRDSIGVDVSFSQTQGYLRKRINGVENALLTRPIALDSFVDTPGLDLRYHAGNVGSWQAGPAAYSNTILVASGTPGGVIYGTTVGQAFYASSAVPKSPDYKVSAVLRFSSAFPNCAMGIAGRISQDFIEAYILWYEVDTGLWRLWSRNGGVTLATYTIALTPGQEYLVSLEFVGSTIICSVDGKPLPGMTVINTLLANAGMAGVFAQNQSGIILGIQLSQFRVDDGSPSLAIQKKYTFIADGDSTFIYTVPIGTRNTIQDLSLLLRSGRYWNFSVSGQTVVQMNADAAAQLNPCVPYMTGHTYKMCIARGGRNDADGGASAATLIANLTAYHSARVSSGLTSIFVPILPRTGQSAGVAAVVAAVNSAGAALMLGNSFAIPPNPALQNPADPTTYLPDGIHLTEYGYQLDAEWNAAAIAAQYP